MGSSGVISSRFKSRQHGSGACNGEAVVEEAVHRVDETSGAAASEFNAQNLADTAWAHAMVKQPYVKLFTGSARLSEQQLREFNAENFANTAWASAMVNQS